MRAITLHKIDDNLHEAIAMEAEARGWSWNKMAKELLGQAVLRNKKKKIFSEFFGSWTKEEADQFRKYDKQVLEKIYPEDWK